MKYEVEVYCGYHKNDQDVQLYHDVSINGEKFLGIPNLPKCPKCTEQSCKYYRSCMQIDRGVVRTFDCMKNAYLVNLIWNFLTAFVVMWFALTYYKTLNLGFFKGTAALLVSMVVLDMVCLGIEKMVEIIRNYCFYRKLKRDRAKKEAIEEKKRLAEEAKRIKEQEEAEAKDPNIAKIREAEAVLAQIATISDAIDFGESDKQVEFCVAKCREIIEHLKKDSSGYLRVESLFQVYLPEFYKILAYYAEFEKAEATEDAQRERLTDTVNYFYNFLCMQKVEAIFDKKTTEIKFNAAANTLRREIEKRGGKL